MKQGRADRQIDPGHCCCQLFHQHLTRDVQGENESLRGRSQEAAPEREGEARDKGGFGIHVGDPPANLGDRRLRDVSEGGTNTPLLLGRELSWQDPIFLFA